MSDLRHRNLPHLLLRAREALMAHFRPLLNEAGLTEQQWRIVRSLLEHGPLESRELSQRCSISSPSIVGVLLRLEETGLLTRERMEHDARRLQVALTPRGQALARKLVPRIEQRYAELEASIGVRPMHDVYDAIDALLARISEPGEVAEEETAAARPTKAGARRR